MIRPIEDHKSEICGRILRALPDWFGIPEAIAAYEADVARMPMWGATIAERTVGFAALKVHTTYASEIHVMGILREHHGHGIGRSLIAAAEGHCRAAGQRFLTVKTLGPGRECEAYARTRAFYERVGFVPIEEFPELWGPDNPCLMLIKAL